ncbi:dTDP-4-dehydrorhamnose reductase [Candidatus Cyanaurora vandensis]|uniref:dTDP-4-dehydrorhamnose reductase n=1 Tax=Candidatus Cyanaurora vandensis TaxID=2714958 RepID=UPI0025803E61|nr:dTDP-4-dehydrorhamnose reductase [Candidatus Cyanaurora vandensis]
MKILLLGKQGQVGHELSRALLPLGEVVAVDRSQLDLAEPESIRTVVQFVRPQVIVNAAAYTAVDRAEQEPELAYRINTLAPEILAQQARLLNAALVHYSTDYVFDGTQRVPYTETDPTSPLGIYGQTKRAGEEAIQAMGIPHLILRTSWVYGRRGKNFLLTILRLARERTELKIVADQVGIPTPSNFLAQTTTQILQQSQGDPAGFLQTQGGLYHLTCTGVTTWYDFTRAILSQTQDPERQVQTVYPITTDQYPTPARRPAYSVLNTERIQAQFGFTLPTWQEALADLVAT